MLGVGNKLFSDVDTDNHSFLHAYAVGFTKHENDSWICRDRIDTYTLELEGEQAQQLTNISLKFNIFLRG